MAISGRTPNPRLKLHRLLAWSTACVCLLAAASAGAQTADAVLGGRVIVEGGLGVAGADVLARREGTKVRRKVKTDARGVYLFPPLPPGTWDVEASADGYTIAVVGNVRLGVAHSRRLDLVLEPAEGQEMVTFFDYAPLRSTGPEVGIRLDRWEVGDLPLRSRSMADLVSLSPISIDLAARLDGGVVAEPDPLPLSSIHGAAILSHSYGTEFGAEFGGFGGVVSLLTRSGGAAGASSAGAGAAGAGSAFALYRDKDLDAPAARRHLGASFGGPLKSGKSTKARSHVFAALEDVRDDAGVDLSALVVRGDRHDPQNLLRWRYSGSDSGGSDVSSANRVDALLVGWQTQASSRLFVDFLGQQSNSDGVDLLQLRSDVYAAASTSRGFHDLAFGAESLSTSDTEHWSLYARDRWQAGDRLTLIVGARGDFEDLNGASSGHLAPRIGWMWRLTPDGSHLLRGGAGRFYGVRFEADQFSLGWSWQLHPFLGVTADAVTVVSHSRPERDYDALTVTARSRFTEVFQVRASVSWTDPSADSATRDRTVVTGLYQAPAGVLVALVYRSEVQSGLDLRVAKRVPIGGDVAVELMAEVFNVFDEAPRLKEAEGRRMGQLGLRLSF